MRNRLPVSNYQLPVWQPATGNWQLFFILFAVIFSLSSCFKEKPLNPPTQQGEVQTGLIEMGPKYGDQFFYSLKTNTVLSQNSRLAYDLMFECDASSFHIWLNGAKFMNAVRTGKTDLSTVTMSDANGKKWWYDTGAFDTDSSAIGDWWSSLGPQITSKGEVYIINLGVDTEGVALGYVKMKVNDFSANSYSITYSDLDNQHRNTVSVAKDATRNYRYLRFVNNDEIVDGIEPDKSLWDLCFTHYSVIFYAPYYLPYQVTGVLSNPSRIESYMDSTVAFGSVGLSDFNDSRFSNRRDIIGYEWKKYGLGSTSTYMVNPHYVYYIRAATSERYKLHFYSFYKSGLTGYPGFEFVRF